MVYKDKSTITTTASGFSGRNGTTDELLIILGILAIAAVTSCVVWYLVVRRKRKVRDTKAIHSEKKDTRETSQRKD
ncbi:hypothetical protein ACJMK2_012954 [Sinanodonta woodiana]|uniref:LPXTG cell wall anchor domain-containing protein n=1 Tax=Sinanodonta woodiana TaxID=1069815 RepID=A0ABD3VBF7_SINWO